ncbi:MAG: fumarylacetoacetate hydrolase family protein [Bacteroidales bacterium]|nr:fumarylacetoacetate hydrolase family protein [Bacteroidales bacterium]
MKIICAGLNYRNHALEMGREIPTEPVIFLKADSSLLKKNKPFFIPDFSERIEYEAELVLKICKVGRYITPAFAHRYYNEITLGVDFTARDLQSDFSRKGLPWELSKAFDGAAPIGMFIPKEEAGDVTSIDFTLIRNEEVVQQGNSSDLIFDFDALISRVSQFFTLKTGDLIFTGTPAGVGRVFRGDRLRGLIGEKIVFDFAVK